MRILALTLIAVAAPAAAQVRAVPDQPASASSARNGVDVFLINDSDAEVPAEAPARLEVMTADATRIALVPAERGPATIAPHGFAKVRYLSGGVLSVAKVRSVPAAEAAESTPPADAEPVAVASADVQAAEPMAVSTDELTTRTSNGSGAFLNRFLVHEPIYGVFGLNDAGGKLQFSFGFQPFTGTGALSHLKLAYTQTMFWAIDRPSGPFRQTVYSPEAFVDFKVTPTLTLAGGYRHDSNGRGLPLSIDVNRIYVRAAKSFDLGDGWQAELVPQAWFYIDHRGAYQLNRYWGYTSLKASIGQFNGLKLAVTARGNPGTGKGGAELFASYPLTRAGGLGLYLFGQAFTGYGEALDDFRINDTHARLGIALTR